jgi:hypothetical protein
LLLLQGSWEDPVSQAASIDSKEKQQFLDRIADMEKQMKAAELAAHSAALNLQEEKKKLVRREEEASAGRETVTRESKGCNVS